MTSSNEDFRCGYVAIIGRPNVGKSTLLNQLVGQKISITADKPQTTRHQILAVNTTDDAQIIYVDTPGLHIKAKRAINRYMNKAAASIITDVDVVVFVVQAMKWTEEDQSVLDKIKQSNKAVILAVNKIDWITEKERLLPYLADIQKKHDFCEIIPVSALKTIHLDELQQAIRKQLPVNTPFFPEDQVTDRSVRFLVAEIIREKLFRELGDELPYQTTVEIESYKEEDNITHIHANILVETKGQKAIVLGKKGERLKSMSTSARHDIQELIEQKVFLRVWVKVRSGWSDDEQALQSLGYTDLE